MGADGFLADRFFETIWSALQGEPEVAKAVSFSGDAALRGRFAYTDLCASTLAAASAAIAELLMTAGQAVPSVHVDRVLAPGWVLNLSDPVGPRIRPEWPWTVNGDYRTADDRFLRITATYKHLQDRTLAVLGTPEDSAAVAAEILRHPANEIERAIVDGGGAAAASRTLEEWAEHPQGRSVRTEPLVEVSTRGTTQDRWRPTSGRPLAGIRVLDCTRVVAGPMATRWLAGFGAEVLRIDPPGFDEWIVERGSVTLGKRCAELDLRAGEGRDKFLELLAGADVFVHGLRPGALDALGLDDGVRQNANPNLVEVQHNAYGWTGPWVGRRGFDSIVCVSSGIWLESLRWAGSDAPGPDSLALLYPILLDHCAGYLDAAAAVRGLTRRLREGTSSLSRLSLARMLWMLIDAGQPVEEPPNELPLPGPYEDRVYMTAEGPVRRLEFPAKVEDNPFFWERPADPYATSAPLWSTSPLVGRTAGEAP